MGIYINRYDDTITITLPREDFELLLAGASGAELGKYSAEHLRDLWTTLSQRYRTVREAAGTTETNRGLTT